MKFTYRTLVFSICEDLTNPTARSFPIGVLALCDFGVFVEASLAHCQLVQAAQRLRPGTLVLDCGNSAVMNDPVIRAVINNLPRLLRSHFDELQRAPHRSLEELAALVHNSLRNTLHVSSVSPPATGELPLEKEVATFDATRLVDFAATATRIAASELYRVLLSAGAALVAEDQQFSDEAEVVDLSSRRPPAPKGREHQVWGSPTTTSWAV